eukprot:s3258_g3.t1
MEAAAANLWEPFLTIAASPTMKRPAATRKTAKPPAKRTITSKAKRVGTTRASQGAQLMRYAEAFDAEAAARTFLYGEGGLGSSETVAANEARRAAVLSGRPWIMKLGDSEEVDGGPKFSEDVSARDHLQGRRPAPDARPPPVVVSPRDVGLCSSSRQIRDATPTCERPFCGSGLSPLSFTLLVSGALGIGKDIGLEVRQRRQAFRELLAVLFERSMKGESEQQVQKALTSAMSK